MNEEVVKFGSEGRMVGILSAGGETESSPVILMFNAGFLHRVGPFRLWVDCAREFATQQIPSLRFDLCGLGDSQPGESAHDPVKQAVECQMQAMDFVESRLGKRDFIVLGLCSGADYAHSALKADPRIRGAVMIDGCGFRTRRFLFSRYLQRVCSPRRWRNLMMRIFKPTDSLRPEANVDVREFPDLETVQSDLISFLEEGRRLHFIYTAGVPEYYNYKNQFWEMFPRLKPQAGLSYTYYGKSDHTFSLVGERRELMVRLVEFVSQHQSQTSRTQI